MTKVLLVEDDNNLREIYEARLAAEGYDIATAKDGEDALAVAKQEKPDLIISDVMMPRISGFEMLDILRNTEELKHTKVIMLTALGQVEDKSRADNLGADRYLVKSQVTLEDIVKAAEELLNPATEVAAEPTAAPAAAVPAAATTVTPEPVITTEPAPTPPAAAVTPVAVVDPAPVADTPVVAPEPAVAPTPIAEPPVVAAAPIEPTPEPIDTPEPVPAPQEPQAAPAPAPVATPPQDDVVVTPITITEPAAQQPTSDDAVVTEPTAEPEAPVAEPAVQMPQPPTDPDVVAVTENVQSALEESAQVDQQIKDFAGDTTPVEAPAEAPVIEPIPQPTAAETEPSVSQIPGKLVIQPPTDHADEPDISALVAQEEYQEQQASGIAGTPTVSTAPDQPAEVETHDTPAPQPGGVFMPNNNGNADDTAL
jgi:CheY-like chemotaxis protein